VRLTRDAITALQSIISQDALDKKAENARELGLSYDDAVKGGVGIMLGGKRIDPSSIYAEPKIGCVNHDCDQCKAVQEPVAQPASEEDMKVYRAIADNYRKDLAAAQPAPTVQEPFMWVCNSLDETEWETSKHKECEHCIPLYTTPLAPQPVPVKTYHDGKPWPVAPKPWVGLTDEEIDLFINGRGDEDDDNYVEPTGDGFGLTDADLMTLVRRAEAKLKEKNHG
jgi:hypothetical protein